jgi:hypothetical protein
MDGQLLSETFVELTDPWSPTSTSPTSCIC